MSSVLPRRSADVVRRAFHVRGVPLTARKISSVRSTFSPFCVKAQGSVHHLQEARNSRRPLLQLFHMMPVTRRSYSNTVVVKRKKHRAYVALGSNMGDRIHLIEQACRLLDEHDSIKVLRTSGLWETKAMYVVDQADFLNGACEVGMLTHSNTQM